MALSTWEENIESVFKVLRCVLPCIFEGFLNQAIDIFDDMEKICLRFFEVVYLGDQEFVPLSQSRMFFQSKRIDTAQFLEFFEGLVKDLDLFFAHIGP